MQPCAQDSKMAPTGGLDSTTITVEKNRLHWALYHRERSGIKIHVSYTPETCMPLDAMETTGLVHDGTVGERLADPRFILVQDPTYLNIKRTDRFLSDKQDFIIRMKENIELSTVRSLQRLPEEGSNVTRDFTCWLGTPQSCSKKRHRRIYKARWGIESLFRWIKKT